MSRLTTSLVFAASFWAAFAQPALSLDKDAKAAVARLLEVGWTATPQARTAADVQYQEVQRLAGGEKDAVTASMLVLMQQRRFDEAAKRAGELLAADPNDALALRAKIWIAAILKNYEAAMISADKFSAQLEANPAMTEEDKEQRQELIAFLGRMFGFLGGPVADVANQEQRKAYEKQVLARLDESEKPLFEEARDGVLQKFIETTDAKLDERERAIADSAASKEKTLQELEADRQQMAERTQQINEEREKLQSELRDELAELERQDAPLETELARLDARARILDRELFSYQAEISRLQAAAAAEEDPVLRNRLFVEADRLSLIAARVESELFGLNRQGRSVQSQRASLANRAQRARSSAAGRIERMDKELAELAKRQRRNEGIERRATRPATGTTGRGRSLSAQATALSTYDQFPLEAERQKLLESLR